MIKRIALILSLLALAIQPMVSIQDKELGLIKDAVEKRKSIENEYDSATLNLVQLLEIGFSSERSEKEKDEDIKELLKRIRDSHGRQQQQSHQAHQELVAQLEDSRMKAIVGSFSWPSVFTFFAATLLSISELRYACSTTRQRQ